MKKSFWIYTLLTANLVGLGILLFTSILEAAPTFDEPPHILSGYVALKYGQNYIDPEHPLLIKSLAASPLVFQDLKFNQSDPNYANQKTEFNVDKMFTASRSFLTDNDMDKILLSTRIPMIFLTMFFGLIIFLFGRKLFGNTVALLATFFYSTEPLILANGPLVNTDIVAAGFILTSLFALYLYWENQSNKRLIFLTVALTSALLSKFSTFYLLPIVLVAMEVIYRWKGNFYRRHLIYLLAGVVGLISVFYGLISFRSEGWSGFIPSQYLEGLVIIFAQVSTSARFTYLLGEGYYGSRIYYFPVLIVLKTQILTLVGFVLSLFFIWKNKLKLSSEQILLTLGPVVIFLGFALLAKFNIGVRHVLPLYPVAIIFAAAGFVTWFNLISKYEIKIFKNKLLLTTLFFGVLIAVRLWSVGSTYPHFLSYYNQIAGGTDKGWLVSNDANYDWGQDVKRLATWVKENKVEKIALDNYSGNFAANYYGINTVSISPRDTNYKGYLALSTSVITFHEGREENYIWLTETQEPIARAGKSIFIYKLD